MWYENGFLHIFSPTIISHVTVLAFHSIKIAWLCHSLILALINSWPLIIYQQFSLLLFSCKENNMHILKYLSNVWVNKSLQKPMSGFVVFPLVGCWDIAFFGGGGGSRGACLTPTFGQEHKTCPGQSALCTGICWMSSWDFANKLCRCRWSFTLIVHLSTQVINGNGEFTDRVTLRWTGISSRGR